LFKIIRLFSLQCFSHFGDLLVTVPLATRYHSLVWSIKRPTSDGH